MVYISVKNNNNLECTILTLQRVLLKKKMGKCNTEVKFKCFYVA